MTIPAPILAFAPAFPGDRQNYAQPGSMFSDVGTGLSWAPSQYGVGFLADNAGNGMLRLDPMEDARHREVLSVSLALIFSWDDSAASSNWGGILFQEHSFDGLSYQRFSSNLTATFTLQTSTERVEIRNDGATLDTGNLNLMIFRWISDVEWELSTYRLPEFTVLQERVQIGAANVPGGIWVVGPTDGVFLGGSNSSSVGLSGLKIHSYLFWNRVLTRRQLKAAASNPHALILPGRRRLPFVPLPAGSPGTMMMGL